MVQDTGKTLRADTLKSVNTPEPLRVEEDATGLPVAVRMPRRYAIQTIEDRWQIDDEWWRAAPVSRLYFIVIITPGQRLVLFKDILTGSWYRQG